MHIDWSVSEYFFQDIRQDKPKWRLCIECNLFFHVAERFLSVIAIKLRNAFGLLLKSSDYISSLRARKVLFNH